MWLIDGWLGYCTLMVLMALPFNVALLRVMISFLGAIGAVEEAFKKAF